MDLGLFSSWQDIGRAVARAALLFGYSVVLLRVSGKRTTMTMTSFDFISTVVMATLIGTTILSETITIVQGMAALTTIVALQYVVAYGTSRSDRLRSLVTANPRLLFDRAGYHDEALRAERVSRTQLEGKLRQAGYASTDNVALVVMESDGSVSVIGAINPAIPPADEARDLVDQGSPARSDGDG